MKQGETNAPDVKLTLRSLYDVLFAPLMTDLGNPKNLIAIPDGQLALVPIGGFLDRTGHYVLERYTVSYLTFADELYTDRSRVPTALPLIIGNPDYLINLRSGVSGPPRAGGFRSLVHTADEINDVKTLAGVPENRILTGRSAREATLKSAESPLILHIATHGNDPSGSRVSIQLPPGKYKLFEFPTGLAIDDPLLRSYIALAGANTDQTGPEDGILTALEVASLKLVGTKLVFVTSCWSGSGVAFDGQGVLGLRAAFLMAGAEALITSLWQVDDASAGVLVRSYYSHLGEGRALALRKAQLELMRTPGLEHPFYWASYMHSGDFAPIALRRPSIIPTPSDPKPEKITVAPRCYEFSGYIPDTPNSKFTLRLRIAGSVDRTGDETAASYFLAAPGAGISIVDEGNRRLFSDINGSVLFVTRSTVTLQIGMAVAFINLVGKLPLFPTVEIPERLPPLSAYRAAIFGWPAKGSPTTLTSVSSCRPQ